MIKSNGVFASIVMLGLAMGSIQFGASLAKRLFPVVGAAGAASLRIGFATIILCAIWRPWNMKFNRAERLAILAYGFSLGAMNLTFYLALDRIPLGIAVALEFTGPLAVALFASRKRSDYLWAILAFTGIVLLMPAVKGAAALDPAGIAYALIAGACWALYIVFGQRAGALMPGGLVTSLGMVIAALFALPFGLAHAGGRLFSPSLFPLAVGVAALSSALPYSLEMSALKSLPAKNFGILMSLEPAIAALSGLVFLGEKLTALHWIAIACVMLASFGSAIAMRRQAATVS